MGSKATRSVFAAALCTGVAMVGVSVHGLLGVDAELERSVLTAQARTVDTHSVRVVHRVGGECDEPGPVRDLRHRT